MNLAAQIINHDLNIYIESLSIDKCFSALSKETVRINLLVFTDGLHSTFHDPPYTAPNLSFCLKPQTVSAIQQNISKTGFQNPTELAFGNAHFHLRKWFPGAYRITFYDFQKYDLYNRFIGQILPSKNVKDFNDMLIKEGNAATGKFLQKFVGIGLNKFAQRRFDLWHEKTVKQFEEALAKGSISCADCDSTDI